MAELFKAQQRGVQGFQKIVAIKRILPHFSDNEDFVTMFIDEAKLAAQLTHPNIVQIFDLGKAGSSYYIAMEYVNGRDLRTLLKKVREYGTPFPEQVAAFVVMKVAAALDYAHRKRGFDDRELKLVHRDISPQNVILSTEGAVKLVDFGIAKAASKASHTVAGALKGKLLYMSPEQATGQPLDNRSDLYSLGLVLFELLTGRRLFAGESEMSVLESVREGRIQAPRDLDARLPLEINTLVLKALGKDPADRFASAGEMQREIEKILFALKPTPAQGDLAFYVRRLFDLEPAAGAVHAPAPAERPAATPPARPAAPAPTPAPPTSAIPARPVAPPVQAVEPLGDSEFAESAGGGSKNLLYGGIAAAAVIGIALFLFFGRGDKAPAPTEPPAAAVGAPAAAPDTDPATTTAAPVASAPAAALPAATAAAPVAVATPTPGATPAATATPEARATATAAPTAIATVAPPTPEPAPATPEPTPVPPPAPTPAPTAAPRVETAPAAPSVRRGDLVELGPGVATPVLVTVEKPQYPPIARRLKAQGEVVVSVLVDENGRVVETKLTRPYPQDVGFNEAAMAAARTATFRPATKEGVPVKVWFQLRIPFKL